MRGGRVPPGVRRVRLHHTPTAGSPIETATAARTCSAVPNSPAGPPPGRHDRLSIAVGVRRGVTSLQPDLVDSTAAELVAVREEALVDAQPAVRLGVEFRHPRADAVRVELV